LPVHASWLNQVEIFFSILQPKAHAKRFPKPGRGRERLHGFAKRFNTDRKGKPFDWKFTRHDLHDLLERYSDRVLTSEARRKYRDTG